MRAVAWFHPIAIAVAMVVGGGCASPSAVRRTTLIPTPTLPARAGAPLAGGQARAGVELNGIQVPPLISVALSSEAGDPGVLVPDFHLGASFYYGLHKVIELGVRLQYVSASWADPNVVGVLPFPDGTRDDFWSGGVGTRLNFEFAGADLRYLTLSVITELNMHELPEVVFVLGEDVYELESQRSKFFLAPNAALQFGFRQDFGETGAHALYASALAGAQTSVTNVGFDTLENMDDDTTESFWVVYVGPGIDYRYDHFFISGHAYHSFEGQARIHFGLRAQLQVGAAF